MKTPTVSLKGVPTHFNLGYGMPAVPIPQDLRQRIATEMQAVAAGRHCDMKVCGRGCTEAEYQRAVAGAAALVAGLGPDWKPVVHENLGWHYRAELTIGGMDDPAVAVHQYQDRQASGPTAVLRKGVYVAMRGKGLRYTAFLWNGKWVGEGRTPWEAVRHAADQAKAQYTAIGSILSVVNTLAFKAAHPQAARRSDRLRAAAERARQQVVRARRRVPAKKS